MDESKQENTQHAVKFLIFSISAGVIQAVSFSIFHEVIGWVYWMSYLISLLLSVLWNFTLNRKFTFKSAGNVPVAMLKVALFYAIFTPISVWVGKELSEANINAYLILIPTMLTNLITEFLYTKYYVYKGQINTAV